MKKPMSERNNNLITNKSRPSPRLKHLLKGMDTPGVFDNPIEPPSWLDMKLFQQGQKFFEKYLFCIFISDILGVISLLCVNRILRPLIFTGKTDTALKALKRYVSTIAHVMTWYKGNVWNKNDHAHIDVINIRNLHKNYEHSMNTCFKTVIDNVDVKSKGHFASSCPFYLAINSDFSSDEKKSLDLDDSVKNSIYLSQFDMAYTQYAFMGLIIVHYKKLGIWHATEKDFESYVHFWRGIGWLLGIKDEYNVCSGNLQEVRFLCLEIEKCIVQPSMTAGKWDYEHMSVSLFDGLSYMTPGITYPTLQRYIFYLFNIESRSLNAMMTLSQKCMFFTSKFIMLFLFKIPGMVGLFNNLVLFALYLILGNPAPWWWPSMFRPSVTVSISNNPFAKSLV